MLDNNKSPSRKVGEIDNRGSHFYIAQYWAQALANQDYNRVLKAHFEPIAQQLTINENKIMDELLRVQGVPVDLGGYYHNSQDKVSATMRPSLTLNTIIDHL